MCEGFLFFWRLIELGDSCRPREFPQLSAFEEGGVFVLFVYNLIQRFHTLNLRALGILYSIYGLPCESTIFFVVGAGVYRARRAPTPSKVLL